MFSDTPLPPEEPTGKNPPDGAIIDYNIGKDAKMVTLEISDFEGNIIRKFSSSDPVENLDTNLMGYPTYWFRPSQKLHSQLGHHRFVWDLRYAPPKGSQRSYAIAAVYKNTPAGPDGPFVHPGFYKVKLHVDSSIFENIFEVKMDPRVSASNEDLQIQSKYSLICHNAYQKLQNIKTVLTIHNAQYHGSMGWDKSVLIPRWDLWKRGLLEWNGIINPLATAIKCADKVTTVSPTYMHELKLHSNGLDSLFENEQAKCVGILNGIDVELWNPATDPMVLFHYNLYLLFVLHFVTYHPLHNKILLLGHPNPALKRIS
jgi:hypothetical protein